VVAYPDAGRNCPYCSRKLDPVKRRDWECPHCKEFIIVRPTTTGPWLLTKTQAAAWDGEDTDLEPA
jgi:hypothetical protein